jgi:4'-phosphopantetheinyl transferase EntD
MIESLLPATVAVVEAEARMWEPDGLLPEEAAQLQWAVARRRREFAAGRACARRALAQLGLEVAPLLIGPDRAPLWPQGTVGSITHCEGYCAAAAARSDDLRSLGIDAELNRPLSDGVARQVLTREELARTRGARAQDGIEWPALCFSAKESLYKAWHPLARRWLGYLDAEIVFDPRPRSFEVRLLAPTPDGLRAAFSGSRGRFAATPEHLFTAIAVPAPASPAAH